MPIDIFIPKEELPEETRVALVPALVERYRQKGVQLHLDEGAGTEAGFPDSLYENVSVDLGAWSDGDLVLCVNMPSIDAIKKMKKGAILAGLMAPYRSDFPTGACQERQLTVFSLELLPRISRAQSMDALSSQAAASGYRSALLAAMQLPRFFPMLTTAAGTIRPARVLVIGAGVAGLQAIATARRLGAMVWAYDVRAAAREQVESLGARFVDTGVAAEGAGGYARALTAEEEQQQASALADQVKSANVVITTAAVPGKPAPKIVSAPMVEAMAPGSVIVDLAAPSGGNCELTEVDKTVSHKGVQVIGPRNLAATLAGHASEMYARNLFNFVSPWFVDEQMTIDWDDEIYAKSAVLRDGEIIWEALRTGEEGKS